MNHLLVAPILIPLTGGVLAVLLRGRAAERLVGLLSSLALLASALALFELATASGITAYDVGHWPVPYGITLVLDRLAATMLLVTALLAVAVVIHSMGGADERGQHFHALVQFQLLGVNGAFLTGDLFNLFVFFEVLLIASYALLMHDARPERTRAAVHVVVLNLVGSVLFLIAVGCLYSAAGSLNFADLAERSAALPADREGLWRAGGWLLVIVFALKAALLPLGFWLPTAYAAADGTVAALFAILTKVGVFAILRSATLLFEDLGLGPLLMALALATLVLGAAGMLAARRLAGLAAHATIVSVGTLLVAASFLSVAGVTATVYYLMHGTLATAVLFLLADRIAAVRGAGADRLEAGVALRGRIALPIAFLLAAVAVVGLPPLSGFIAKIAVLQAAAAAGEGPLVFAVLLGVTLLSIVAIARAGSLLFWKAGPGTGDDSEPLHTPGVAAAGVASGLLLLALGLLTVLAGPAFDHAEATARELLVSDGYVQAVRASRAAIGDP